MNKYLVIFFFASILFLTQNCKVKEYQPEFQLYGGMTEADSLDLLEAGEIGFHLYKQYCGSCHGITHKGQSTIPNFTNEQLEDYNLRWQMEQGKTHGKLDELSDNQLNNILIFLQYRKRQ